MPIYQSWFGRSGLTGRTTTLSAEIIKVGRLIESLIFVYTAWALPDAVAVTYSLGGSSSLFRFSSNADTCTSKFKPWAKHFGEIPQVKFSLPSPWVCWTSLVILKQGSLERLRVEANGAATCRGLDSWNSLFFWGEYHIESFGHMKTKARGLSLLLLYWGQHILFEQNILVNITKDRCLWYGLVLFLQVQNLPRVWYLVAPTVQGKSVTLGDLHVLGRGGAYVALPDSLRRAAWLSK